MAATYLGAAGLPPPPPVTSSSASSPSAASSPDHLQGLQHQQQLQHEHQQQEQQRQQQESPLNNNVLGSYPNNLSPGSSSSYVMNLVNSSAAISAAAAASQCYGSSPVRGPHEMHEMKYLPPQHQASLHNGHPLHNPWGIPAHDVHVASHWMHPHAGLYSQDLKQDVKPHSPAEFNHLGRGAAVAPPPPPPPHHMVPHHPSSWNPPPVSSPYLGMTPASTVAAALVSATTTASSGNGIQQPPLSSGSGGGHHDSPSPSLQQHHQAAAVAAYGMNGMLPGQIPPSGIVPHPSFIDRYRDSHNSSPRSMTDEDGMLSPTSGISGHLASHFERDREPFGNEQSGQSSRKRAHIVLSLL
jgi:hypothetical protein